MVYRKLTNQEILLLDYLIRRANKKIAFDWKDKALVRTLPDGGMGSLELFIDGKKRKEKRFFGKEASKIAFNDSDGTLVIASLFLDRKGDLFELDIWKVDYTPVKKISLNISAKKGGSISLYIEKLIMEGENDSLILYGLEYDQNKQEVIIEVKVPSNTTTTTTTKWRFSEVTDFKTYVKKNRKLTFPQLVFGIDLNNDKHVIIACENVDYIFSSLKIPMKIFSGN